MARIAPLFYDDLIYFGQEIRGLVGGLAPHGGSWNHQPYVANQTQRPMQIQIDQGGSYVRESTPVPCTFCASDSWEYVDLSGGGTIPTGQSRWDLVICRPRPSTKDWIFDVVRGTPAATPGVPVTPAATLPICRQRVFAGQTVLDPGPWNAPNFVDLRRPPLPLEHIQSFYFISDATQTYNNPTGRTTLHANFLGPAPWSYTKVYGVASKLVITMNVTGAFVSSGAPQWVRFGVEFGHGTGFATDMLRTGSMNTASAGNAQPIGGTATVQYLNLPAGAYNIIPYVWSATAAVVQLPGMAHQVSLQIAEVPV